MLRRFFFSIALLFAGTLTALAAYPYDSVCEVAVPNGRQMNAGSATLIAVTEDKALLLTCQHVVLSVGKTVHVNWAATGETSRGKVVAIGKNGLDIALIVCPRPEGLEPVPVASFDPRKDEPILNIGYPGVQGFVAWQMGTVISLNTTDLRYTCRPISGMSGGATLDMYGNLVGVIQYYNPKGGGSTGGRKMLEFLRDYILSGKVKWVADHPQHEVVAPTPPEAIELKAPEEWRAFLIYLYTEYDDGPLAYWLEQFDPQPTEAPKVAA